MPPNPAIKKVLCINTCYLPVQSGGGIMLRHEDWYGDERDIIEVPATRLGEFLQTGDFEKVQDEEDEEDDD